MMTTPRPDQQWLRAQYANPDNLNARSRLLPLSVNPQNDDVHPGYGLAPEFKGDAGDQ